MVRLWSDRIMRGQSTVIKKKYQAIIDGQMLQK